MAKICKDFIFNGKKLSDIKVKGIPKYIFVNFDDNNTIPLSLSRDMVKGDSNRYRAEPNYFFDTWNEALPIEFNLVKNPEIYPEQTEREITKDDIRELTRWLTSSHLPKWLKIERDEMEEKIIDATRYKGWFNNIDTWVAFNTVYGLRLSFQCTTSFAYTDDIVNETTVSNYKNLLINNNSDELEGYVYPTFEIKPKQNEQIFICNLSDCVMLENGILKQTKESYFDSLLDIVDKYAHLHGLTVEYCNSDETSNFNIVPLCNDTAIQFYFIDRYNNYTKCTAFYMTDSHEYKIIEGGFMHMTTYENLDIHIDSQKLTIQDSIGRMITYDKLGIKNVDSIYWPRLINGNNSLLLYGHFTCKVKHIESRKVGE